jgi:D-beta-D-heptose 7-phosphate kinase/D-beta-D-heptose 1-phosphate adenosyltransferase
MQTGKRKTIVAVSGGFDPLHSGHTRLFEAAQKLGDELVVILNNDHWLEKKKGFVFMNEKERTEVIKALRAVDRVVLTSHKKNPKDMSVCKELRKIRPHIFANGGDRTKKDAKKKNSSLNPEAALCEELGIALAFNVGRGGKVQSSSWLLSRYAARNGRK